jgi:tyrosyl-tRNA synthetase
VDANMPTTTLSDDDFTDGAISLLDLLVKTGLAPSKGEGRRLIQQNGVSLDCGDGSFAPITDITFALRQTDMAGKNIVIKKGKKVFHKVIG